MSTAFFRTKQSSLRQIDGTIRSRACDALGVALGGFPDQKLIVSEISRSLPPLKSERKFARWLNALADPKTPVDLSQLEQSALTDARLSFEFHAIDCIGLIAGSTSDEGVCIDMIWKLLDLAAFEPAVSFYERNHSGNNNFSHTREFITLTDEPSLSTGL